MAYVRNYGVESYHNFNLQSILLDMVAQIAAISAGGGLSYSPTQVTSVNFTNATDCPLTSFNGVNFILWYNEVGRELYLGTEYHVLVGGGFGIDIPGFDASVQLPHMTVWPKI